MLVKLPFYHPGSSCLVLSATDHNLKKKKAAANQLLLISSAITEETLSEVKS